MDQTYIYSLDQMMERLLVLKRQLLQTKVLDVPKISVFKAGNTKQIPSLTIRIGHLLLKMILKIDKIKGKHLQGQLLIRQMVSKGRATSWKPK